MTAWSAIAPDGAALTGKVDHVAVVMGMLNVSWLRAHMLSELLRRQVEADGTDAAPDGGEGATSEGAATGLIGHVYAADKQSGVFATSEAVRALVKLESEERDRAVRFAKTAHDMGIDERQTALAESQASFLAAVIDRVFTRLELSSEQRTIAGRVLYEELLAPGEGSAA